MRYSAILIGLVAVIVLFGWAFNIPVLASVLPGLVTMKVNTAVGFLLMSFAYVSRSMEMLSKTSVAAISLLCVLSSVQIVQEFGRFDLGIDEIVAVDYMHQGGTGHPGRMSPLTAISFLLNGIAFLLSGRFPKTSLIFLLASGVIGLTIFEGYVLQTSLSYELGVYTSMALHTSVLFLFGTFCGVCGLTNIEIIERIFSDTKVASLARLLMIATLLGPLFIEYTVFSIATGDVLATRSAVLLFESVISTVIFLGLVVFVIHRLLDLERKMNHQNSELASFKDLYSEALEASDVGIWEHDQVNNRLIWDDTTLRMWGIKREEYNETYEEFAESLHEEDRSFAEANYFRSLENPEEPYEKVFRIIKRDTEETRIIRARGKFIRDEQDRPLKAIGGVWDLTEVKESQDQLQDKKMQFEMIQSSSLDGFWDWNLKTDYEYFSPRFKEILGFTNGEFPNHSDSWKKQIFQEDLEKANKAFEEHIGPEKKPYAPIVRYRHKDGSTVWVICRGQALFDENGEPYRMIGSHTDITKMKEIEYLLKRSNEDLERFAYIASHDLQEPLRMVSAFLGLIEDKYSEKLDDKGREWINFAVDGATRMSSLINDLLKYSRSVNVDVAPVKFDLGELVREVTKDHPGPNYTIGEFPVVTSEEIFVRSVLSNLIGNAQKYGANNIEIAYIKRKSGNLVSVSDDGPGIAKEYHDTIFEPFKRLNRDIDGSGIGLAICRTLATKLGGECWVESEEGEGAKFFFSFKDELHITS